jgi:hypothetical protein
MILTKLDMSMTSMSASFTLTVYFTAKRSWVGGRPFLNEDLAFLKGMAFRDFAKTDSTADGDLRD